MDRVLMWGRLRPAPKFGGCEYDNSLVWKDERPEPTQAEMEAEWEVWLAEKAKKESNKEAERIHNEALNAGMVYEGSRYHCDSNATTDLVKALTLFGLDYEEPMPVIDMDGQIHMMTIAEVQDLAKAIGQYQYKLRIDLWQSLQG